MAKDVEERYWSAYGLYWDLKECVKRLAEGNILDVFSLGQADLISHFRLPDKFYGRIKEQNSIKAVYDQVCKGEAATVLVSGNPGIGKTMLIKQCFRQETLNSGRIITGKFDQLERNIPYAAFADAFRSLVRQLISEGKAELERWKKRILLALGRNAAVITEVIPELEWLIGKQPPVDVLSPKEAENRFFMVFRHFIKVFARKKHPLVLFLDDLQWADLASIHLLNYLSRDEKVNYLLIIGAFRENEVDEKHP
jgi:histidine kinase